MQLGRTVRGDQAEAKSTKRARQLGDVRLVAIIHAEEDACPRGQQLPGG